jgi:hypothetical protein
VDYDERADELERDADKMEQESERVGGRIDESRSDWESKEADQQVPGAQAALPGEEDDSDDEDDEPSEDQDDNDNTDDTDEDEESE